MSLPKFSVDNKQFTRFVVILTVIGGLISFMSLGQLEDPDFTIKTAVITTTYAGASPEEVEQEITERIELALQEIQELDYIESTSRAGVSTVKANLQQRYQAADIPQIWDTLRRKIRDVEGSLPPGAGRPNINDDFGDVFGLMLAVTADGFTYAELKSYVDDLRRQLALVDGVGKVDLWGARERVIYLDVSESRLTDLGVSESTIEATIRAQNAVVDAGSLNVGGYRMRIAPSGAFTKPEDIENLVIRGTGLDQLRSTGSPFAGQQLLRVGDIGEIVEGYLDPPRTMLRQDGVTAIALSVSLQPGGNVVDLGRAIDARLAELNADLPIGIEIFRIHWQSDLVSDAVNDFLVSLAQAVAIVLVVITLSMGLRMGAIIGSGLMLTILGTFIVMAIVGVDLQRMSLGALVIALGMMVDNAIVVAEGAAVRFQRGEDRREAAIKAAGGPAIPLLGATVIAVMAFYPIYSSDEGAGEYCATLFSVVGISLMLSWLFSITVTPMQCVQFLKVTPAAPGEAKESRAITAYKSFLGLAIRFRYLTIAVAAGLLALSLSSFGLVSQLFFPDSTMAKFMIDYTAPEGTRIEEVSEDLRRLEERLQSDERVESVAAFIGAGPPRFYLPVDPEPLNPAYAQVVPNVHNYRDIDALIDDLVPWIEENHPEATVSIRKFGVGPSDSWKFEGRIIGPANASPEVLRELGDKGLKILEEHPWTAASRTDWRERVLTVAPEYDQARARWASVTPEDLSLATKRAFDGRTIGLYREEDELIPVVLRHRESERNAVTGLDLVQIQPRTGGSATPLTAVVSDVDTRAEDPAIPRRDRRRLLTVQANPIFGVTLPEYRKAVLADFAALESELPPGYTFEWGGEHESSKDAQASLIPGIVPAVAIMALILVGLFNSFRVPLLIALTVPFVFIGITPGLLFTSTPFGFVAMLGAMSLSGMMMKNAIVLIDEVNLNLSQGVNRYDAILNAGASRLRPVFLAAATTVLGVIPLLGDVFWIGLAVTLMAGLSVGTILTMVLVPVFYATFHGVKAGSDDAAAVPPAGDTGAPEPAPA